MSKTRQRVELMAALVDRELEHIATGTQKDATPVSLIYEMFHQEREYLNVEINDEVDD